MDDEELEELRNEKMKERMEEESGDEQQEAMQDRIWNRAKKYMTSQARERLSNIRAADPEKALAVAKQISMLGRSGRMEKIGDEKMKEILKSIEQEKSESDIKFRR